MSPYLTALRRIGAVARQDPARRSLVGDDGEVLRAAELYRRVGALADTLSAGGVRPGDRVAWAGRNDTRLVLTMLAAHWAGAAFVPLNFRLTTAEARDALLRCSPTTVVVEPELQLVYAPLRGATPVRTWMTTAQLDAACEGAPATEPVETGPDDVAAIVFTSGSSGRPKGVALSHANLEWSARSMDAALPARADDVTLVVAPLFHIGGLNCFALDALGAGRTVVLHRAFDPARVLAALTGGVTTLFGVPAMYAALARESGFDDLDLSGVRNAVIGGASTTAQLVATFARQGMVLHRSWGMSEIAGGGTLLRPGADPDREPRRTGAIGRPLPHLDVSVRTDRGEPITEPERTGEIWVRGAQVMRAYWDDPDATAAAFTPDGWFRTGDLAHLDQEGGLLLDGRICEVINTGGEKVVPGEVEWALAGLPVQDVVVVGAPDPVWGETVVAVVMCDPRDAPSLDEVRALCGRTLARYKLPTRLVVVPELPRTASGKVDRRALARLAAGADEVTPDR